MSASEYVFNLTPLQARRNWFEYPHQPYVAGWYFSDGCGFTSGPYDSKDDATVNCAARPHDVIEVHPLTEEEV